MFDWFTKEDKIRVTVHKMIGTLYRLQLTMLNIEVQIWSLKFYYKNNKVVISSGLGLIKNRKKKYK